MRRVAAFVMPALAVPATPSSPPFPTRSRRSRFRPSRDGSPRFRVMSGKRDAGVEWCGPHLRRPLGMNVGMGFFLSFLKGPPQVIKTKLEERLAHLGGAARLIPGAEAFLKRAAVLHADAAFKREIDDLKYQATGGPAATGTEFSTAVAAQPVPQSGRRDPRRHARGLELAVCQEPARAAVPAACRRSVCRHLVSRDECLHVPTGTLRRSDAAPGECGGGIAR